MRRLWTFAKWLALVLVGLVVLVVGAFFFLTRTQPGQRIVLDQVVSRAGGALNGELSVGGIHSARLVDGVTLLDVRLASSEGRPFVEADSLMARYALRSFLQGDVILSELVLWQPRVVLERLPGQEGFNFERILDEPDTAAVSPDTAGGGRRILLEDVRLVDGTVIVRTPVEEGDSVPPRALVEKAPSGDGRMREMTFAALNAELPRALLSAPGEPGPVIDIADLSTVGYVYEDPFRLLALEGVLRWDGERLSVSASEIVLPETRAAGQVTLGFTGAQEPSIHAALHADPLALSDFRWAVPDLPRVEGRARVELEVGDEQATYRVSEADVVMGESRIVGEGTVRTGASPPELREVDVRLTPLWVATVERFLPDSLPLPDSARVQGRLQMSGPLSALRVDGELSLDQPSLGRRASTADLSGTFHLEGPPGVSNLIARVDPLRWGLVGELLPQVRLQGPGTAVIEADGRLASGLRFTARLTHQAEGEPTSEIAATGSVQRGDAGIRVDGEATLQPLSFTAMRRGYPDLPVTGEVTGTVRARGLLSDLDVSVDLETPAGALAADARLDARDPGDHYRVEGRVEDFRLSRLVPRLPDPTRVTGTFFADGRGLELETLSGDARVRLEGSRLGKVEVDTAAATVHVSDGVLRLDTVVVASSVVDLEATGALALTREDPSGRVEVAFRADSLEGVRPFLIGDSLTARDTLDALQVSALRFQGIDPDTLPILESIAVGGEVTGTATVVGSLEDFAAQGQASLQRLRYRSHTIRRAELTFSAADLPSLEGRLEATLTADSVEVFGREFAGGRVQVDFEETEGHARVELRRNEAEDYRARAAFGIDSLGGQVHLDQLALRFDPIRWNLQGPATIAWSDSTITVRDFALIRPGPEGMRLAASGTLPYGRGEADFHLDVDGLQVERLAQLAQVDDRRIRGSVDLQMDVTGTARAPRMEGMLMARGVRWDSIALSRVEAEVGYEDRRLMGQVTAWRDAERVLTAEGFVPVDLSLQGAERRLLAQPMDVALEADSLPAALATGLLSAFDDVEGRVSGSVRIQGTPEDIEPSGQLRLRSGAATLDALGVRYRDVNLTFDLAADGTVQVEGEARAGGRLGVTGTVTLDPVENPTFDLSIDARGFQAVARRDVTAALSGDATLTGTFQQPLVEGNLRVEQGEVILEEFQRSSEVVDLSDPRFFDVVDTSLVAARPILQAGQNPFLQNLRLDVDLTVDRGFWLRSEEMNVEMQGELLVIFDRTNEDLALVGELTAVRGTYNAFGRQFQVREGAVEFVGTPGLNPNLTIEAVNRLRTPQGDNLNIVATLEGTLADPRLTLSSDAQPPIAQSDLVSYLIFGRPSYQLGSGESAILQGQAGQLAGAVTGAGSTLLLGTLASELGATLGQAFSFLDYFAITQGEASALGAGGLDATLETTQIEAGVYLSSDLFLALLVQPLAELGASSRNRFAGVRLEWRFADLWTLQGFYEDRFSRQRVTGFGTAETGFQEEKIGGFFLYREWGY